MKLSSKLFRFNTELSIEKNYYSKLIVNTAALFEYISQKFVDSKFLMF